MRKLLASTFVLALLAVAIAAPPIDYDLTCGEELIGVLSLTEGKVHVALVEGASCETEDGVVVVVPEGAPEISVDVVWATEPPTVTATVGEDDAEVVDLVVVPQVAIDGMVDAQRLRAAAMEMRREAAERGEADRDRIAWDDEGAPGDGEPGGPPADAPCDDAIGDGPGGPPDDAPRGDGTGEGSGRRP